MTEFFAQRIDEGRRSTPRPGYCGSGLVDEGWLIMVAAEDHTDAAIIAYKQWRSQQLGCTGLITQGEPGEPRPAAWRIRVWEYGTAARIRLFDVSHTVTTIFNTTEVEP